MGRLDAESLAKELWVTEPKNFDDPIYHPILYLVVDSDDVTMINVDEFEELYSDEEANYWNSVIREKVEDFDPDQTGIRNLTCVYRDGQWLDNRWLLTNSGVSAAKEVLTRTWKDFRKFPCESTLTLLLVRLFETIHMVQSYKEHSCIDYSYKENSVENKEIFDFMRNSLVHNMWVIGDFIQFVKSNLERFGRESFNKVYKSCFEEEYDLYSEVMEFLFDLEMCDITDDLTVKSPDNQ